MTKVHWARGAWAVAAIMATGIASAALPQQTPNDPAGGQAPATTQNQRNWADQRGRAMAGRMDLDHFLVKVVINASKDEIASSRIAQQRSSNPDVKKFAMQMVEDHTRLMNRLEQFRGTEHGERTRGMRRGDRSPSSGAINNGLVTQPQAGAQTTSPAAEGQRGATTQPNAVVQGQGGDQGLGRNMADQTGVAARHNAAREFATVMEEVANQTQRSFERELSQKEGVQFDRCYLGQQVMAHMWLTDALQVFERHASPGLQPILQEGLQVAQQHLTHAKALLSRIEQGQPKSTALQQKEGTNAQ
jgi:predicted outer membrane protein